VVARGDDLRQGWVRERDKMSRNERFRPTCSVVAGCFAAFLLVTLAAGPARADDTITRPGNHPAYNFEVEPHLVFGLGGWGPYGSYDYGGYGGAYGLGVRFGIPIVSNGFVPSINNSVAISFGVDWLHYDGCWYLLACTADYFEFPVALQWNFYVLQHLSVFGELGLVPYHGFLGDCPPGDVCPARPIDTNVMPLLYLGGRYHFSEGVALTWRLGFPAWSVGVSFFP
jgi:hypothetical protein